MKLKRQTAVKIALLVFFFLLMTTFLIYWGNNSGINKPYYDDWGIYNYGQKINGSDGIRGIDINLLPCQNSDIGSNDVIVAVIDSGVDESCEILNGRLLNGWDFYNGDNSVYDKYIHDYHGTYVSTTIARVAPNIKILPVKFMESTSGSLEDAVAAIEYAINHGAKIINCSWNTHEYSEALYNTIVNNPEVLFVCAAGNYNANLDEVTMYPCSFSAENIINVMAINNRGQAHSSSGYGINSVDIAAPGEDVKVILPENDDLLISGTSVATAFVSAAASLLLSEDETLTPNEIKELLNGTAKKIEGLEMLCSSGGCIDITAAICYLRSVTNN